MKKTHFFHRTPYHRPPLLLPYLVGCCIVRCTLSRTPSCNHQRSHCRLLLPPIIVHRHPCHLCRCRLATTAATTTTIMELTVAHCQRKRQQQQHHQHANGSTNIKTFACPDDLDLFNFSTVFFHPWGYVLQYLNVLQYLQIVGDFRRKILVSGTFCVGKKSHVDPNLAAF